MSEPSVLVQVQNAVGYVNLRGDARNADFVSAAERVLGLSLPVVPNTVSIADDSVCWLGPDEWAILTTAKSANDLVDELQTALDGQHVSVNDLSGGQVTLRFSGTRVCDLLAKACTLDFHQSRFATGACSQTGLAKAAVLLVRLEDDKFDVIVRRSFADYLLRWLQRAGQDLGIEFQ